MARNKISEQKFDEIKSSGFGVPRDNSGNVVVFSVGREYTISKGSESLRVSCSQDCPTCLKVIE